MRYSPPTPSRLLALIIAGLVSGCASWSVHEPVHAPVSSSEATEANAQSNDGAVVSDDMLEPKTPAEADNYPKQDLSPDFLYRSMIADIAAQRGQVAAAASTWLELARSNPDPRVAQRALELAFAAGQLGQALEAVSIWRKLDPNDPIAIQTSFTLLVKANRYDDAKSEASLLLKLNPKDAGQHLMQISGHLVQHADKQRALEIVTALTAQAPPSAQSKLALALAQQGAGQLESAIANCDSAIAMRPGWEPAVLMRERMMEGQNPDTIIKFLEQSIGQIPTSIELKRDLAKQYIATARYRDALRLYQSITVTSPSDVDATLGEALAALQLREYPVAESALLRAQQMQGANQAAVAYYLAVCADEMRNLEVARDRLRLVPAGDFQAQARARLVRVLARLGDSKGAAEVLATVPADTDADRIAKIQLEAQTWRELSDVAKARKTLDDGLQQFAGNPDLLYDRSLMLEEEGNIVDAERDLRAYLEKRPDSAIGLNALGYTLANRTARLDEAESLIKRALQQEPENPVIIDSMGWLLYRQGKTAEAIKWLERAFTSLPDPEVAAHYGEALWQLGKHAEARQIWDKGQQLDPKDQVLSETIQRLTGK